MQKNIKTTCTMDCPDTCELEVAVENGSITEIRGGRVHPNTNGFICAKVSKFARRVYHPERLLYPMRRSGRKGEGRFERITWDEAIAEIADRFRAIRDEWGGEAILPFHYGGSNGLLGDEFLDDYFFAKLGASRLAKTFCAAPSTEVAAGMYGKMPGVAFEDYPLAKCIIIWGANPKVSNIHLMPYLRRAGKQGAFIAVVDPVNNFSTREIDLHLPVLPGTDLPVALAMVHLWHERGLLDRRFLQTHAVDAEELLLAASEWPLARAAEVACVEASDIEKLAFIYAESTPAVIRCGWGTERNRNGGQALAAVMAMPALLGKFGVRGGGYTMSNSGAVILHKEEIFGKFAWNTREINMTQLGRILQEAEAPPVKSLFVYNCNPAATAPNQALVERGLLRDDLFTVVFEQVMTDTAKFADILLPAVTFLEQREIKKAYGSYVLGEVWPAISPRGESKSNEEVFALLGRAMGWDDPAFGRDTNAYIEKVRANIAMGDSVMRIGAANGAGKSPAGPVQFETVFPNTTDGKIHLSPPCLGGAPYQYVSAEDEVFPLALISPATSKMISSTLGEFNYGKLLATLHPDDAACRGINTGDTVRVFSQLGEVLCKAAVSPRVRPGVVVMPKGAWRKSSQNGYTSNALCPDHVNVVGGGACYNDARVEVEKIA